MIGVDISLPGGGGGGGGAGAMAICPIGWCANRWIGVLSKGEASVTGVNLVLALFILVFGKLSRPAQNGSTGVKADMAIGVEVAEREGPDAP